MTINTDQKKISGILGQKEAEIIDRKSLETKLKSGKRLIIKLGADPTAPDLHLGHSICLKKMKDFQELGHKIVFIIGDFTAKIGDPSGKAKTRPALSDGEIEKNTKTYLSQVGKILDVKKIEVRKNSEWFSKVNLADFLKIAANFTVARILERDDFQKRMGEGQEIAFHEIIYPILQAYDSFIIKADVEFGGTDQRFNILAGRDFQQKMGQIPQDVILLPLLLGLDGKKKMSKSLGNYIGVTESPKDQYGKIMSIPDSLILHYFDLCTDVSAEDMEKIRKEFEDPQINPRDLKARLAKEIVSIYHGEKKADEAEKEFDRVVREKQPQRSDCVLKVFAAEKVSVNDTISALVNDIDQLKQAYPSKTKQNKLIKEGGFRVFSKNDNKFNSIKDGSVELETKEEPMLKIGKKTYIIISKGK